MNECLFFYEDRRYGVKRGEKKSFYFSTALQGAAWGSQDASHAADATGRRALSCPCMGRVPGQRAKEPARLSRQPARSHRRQPPSTPSLVLEEKKTSSFHSTENAEMLQVL